MHDLLIRDADVVNGKGVPRQQANMAIGDLKSEAVKQAVDAEGRVLAPGFIDIHTHYDTQITWDPMGHPVDVAGRDNSRLG